MMIITNDNRQQQFKLVCARRECHLCRVAGNTAWSHMACEFP